MLAEMYLPPLVCLDSSTWGLLAKNRGTDPGAKRILDLFQSHRLIPFFTEYHVTELIQHADDSVFYRRVNLIKALPFIAFLKLPIEAANVGDAIPLREAEIAVLLKNPKASHEEVIEMAGPNVRSGFCSGGEFCESNVEWWEIYRRCFAADRRARRMEIESITHCPIPGAELGRKIPIESEELRLRTDEERRQSLEQTERWLAEELRNRGDKRLQEVNRGTRSPGDLAASFLKSVSEGPLPFYKKGNDFYEGILAKNGIKRSDLPAKPTVADFGYALQFIKCCEIHEDSLNLPRGTIRQTIREEMLPSWIVWREVDRMMKCLHRAEGSASNDKLIVSFALYVDALEADKRVRDCVLRAGKANPLLQLVNRRLLQRTSCDDLARQLEGLSPVTQH